MPAASSAITVGSLKIPHLLLGLLLSLAGHAGLLVSLAFLPSGFETGDAQAPQLEYALGQPIEMSIDMELPPDLRSPSPPMMPTPSPPAEPSPSSAPEPPADPSSLRDIEDSVAASPPQPAGLRASTVAIAAVIEAVQSIDWSEPESAPADASVEPPAAADAGEDQARQGRADLDDSAPDPSPPQSAPAPTESPTLEPGPSSADEGPLRPAESPPSLASASAAPAPTGIDRGASVLDMPPPVYPRRCVRLGQQGTVVIEVSVRPDGGVDFVRLFESSGHELLDRAALLAARKGRYQPALEDGSPIAAVLRIPFEFRLRSAQ